MKQRSNISLSEIQRAYFIGIGGIGMSALARWFNLQGVRVSGYDLTLTKLTQQLTDEGIIIHYEEDVSKIDTAFLSPENTVVVYTPAISSSHLEMNYFIKNNIPMFKRAEILGIISKEANTIAVAGTHGKTTTASMIAHLLQAQEKGCSAFLGGIMTSINSNLIIGEKGSPVVIEADEFDKSFLYLHPNYTIVTSLEADHLDIYGDINHLKDCFKAFILSTSPEGSTLIQQDVTQTLEIAPSDSYALEGAPINAKNIHFSIGKTTFEYCSKKHGSYDFVLPMVGYHNVENALAAITVALDMGMPFKAIDSQLKKFKGVQRRFEVVFNEGGKILIDDYAHHPGEISSFLKSVRALIGDKKMTAIFQPHLYSRTRDFQDGFAISLQYADEVLLLPIYPAREKPIEGITSAVIAQLMDQSSVQLIEKSELIDTLSNSTTDVLVTIGAGDIFLEIPKIEKLMKQQITPKG